MRHNDPEQNLAALRKNIYPGRGIVAGIDESGLYFFQLYWIMGRKENSRNRIFKYQSGRLKTAPADPAKVQDPSLIMYNAMSEYAGQYIVSNGHQTDAVHEAARGKRSFREALEQWEYEPDAPNFTPRITSVFSFQQPTAFFSIIRKAPQGPAATREYYAYDNVHAEKLPRGVAYCITTYEGDGDPLPSFKGGPYPLPLHGSGDMVLSTFWNVLNPDNRVAIALKCIEIATGISAISVINRYEKVAA